MIKNKYLFFLSSISLSIVLFIFVSINNVFASSEPSSLVFTTDERTADVSVISDTITIQTRDVTGSSTSLGVIGDLFLTSSSVIGEFSTNNLNWSPIIDKVTFNSNWSNKNFYYKNSVAGTDIITARLVERTSGITFTATQNIYIGTTPPNSCTSFTYSAWGACSSDSQTRTVLTSMPSDCTGGSPVLIQSCTVGSTSTSTNTQTTKTVTRTVYVSTHSGEEELSGYNEKTAFEISAGRERMALVGSPIEFNAKYTLLQSNQCTPSFNWSFGDGFEAAGNDVKHTYRYPGEYQVVLNGNCGNYSSISRTLTKVTAPNIIISDLPNGDTEISNNAKTEVNIGNWKIKSGQKEFIFPKDTIISANNKIILSKEDLNYSSSSERVSMNNPSGREVAYFNSRNTEQENTASLLQSKVNQSATVANGSEISIAEAERLVGEYKRTIALNKPEINKYENTKAVNQIESSSAGPSDSNDIIQTASVLEAVSSSSSSFWSKLIDVPVESIKSFAHIFYNF